MKKSISLMAMALGSVICFNSCNEKEFLVPSHDNAGVPFEISAGFADTKTTNDGMQTKWASGDAINLFHAVAGSTSYISDGQFTLDDTREGVFTGTLKETLSAGEYDWYAFYPYGDFNKTPASKKSGYNNVGAISMTQNGNDSKAHLSGTNCPLYGVVKSLPNSEMPAMTMRNLTSVIAVVVKNTADTPLSVSNVSFTSTADIVGTYYIDFTGDAVVYTPLGDKYVSSTASLTVNNGAELATNESATFYIPIKPHTAASGEALKLSVNGYEKSITLTKDVTFTAGKIKTLNFNFDVAQTTFIWDLSVDSTSEVDTDHIAWSNDVADMVCNKEKSAVNANNYYPGTKEKNYTSTRFYENSVLTITPKSGEEIMYYVFESTSESYASVFANSSWINADVEIEGTKVIVVPQNLTKAVSAVIGGTCGFKKVECHTDALVLSPVISVTPVSLKVEAAGDVCTIQFSIKHPVDGQSISAISNKEWVNAFDYSKEGEISFAVDENSGEKRSAEITLSYEGAPDVIVSVSQNGVGDAPVVSKTVTLRPDWNSLFGTSYSGTIKGIKANGWSVSGIQDDVTISVSNGTSTNGYLKKSDFRMYNNYTVVLSVPSGRTITKITSTKGGKTFTSGISADTGDLKISNNSFAWEGSSSIVNLAITGTVSFATISVTYE